MKVRCFYLPTIALCLLHGAMLCVAEPSSPINAVTCDGDYQHHLQGICLGKEAIYWSFTTQLVKTDNSGKIIAQILVANHHGDLCFHDNKVYVAVNLGRFNDPEGNADSWVYTYDAHSLELLSKYTVPEVFHGAGGIGVRDGNFYVVGGLPDGIQVNYVYEYDGKFQFIQKHTVQSGWTRLGVQTATWHDNSWWFGCYGSPKILLKADADFKLTGRYEFDCALGIVGYGLRNLLIAKGPRTSNGRCRGSAHLVRPDSEKGLVFAESE